MPIDASIALQGRGVTDPLESYGKALSLKSLMGQQQMQEMQMRQAQQQEQEQMALNEAYRSSTQGGQVDRTGLLSSLAQRGLGSRIPGIQKQFADADKAGVDVTNTKSQISERDYKTAKLKLDAMGASLSSLVSNPNVTHNDVIRTIQQQVQGGVIDPQQGAQMVQALPGNPQQLRPFLMQKGLEVMDAGTRMEMLAPKIEYKQTGKQMVPVDTNSFTNPTPQALAMTTTPGEDLSSQTQRRGQNMVDARSRESTAATLSKPFEITGPDGLPVLVQQDKQGAIKPVAGYSPKGMGATKLTEDQGKATGWLSQATNAFENMKAATATNPGAAKPGIADAVGMIPWLGAAGNGLRSGDRQKYMQASSSMSEALLRAATGAGVNESEAKQKISELTPQFGDTDAVIQQKMDAIPVYIESLKVRAGPGAKQVPEIMERAKPIGAVMTVKTDADYAKIPSGTKFTAPDGSVRVKP